MLAHSRANRLTPCRDSARATAHHGGRVSVPPFALHDAVHWSDVGATLAKIDATNCAASTKGAIRVTALTAARQIEVRRASWD